MVYFGPKDQLKEGGNADTLPTVSMIDRYKFDDQRAGFFYNSDPECRKERDLDPEKSYVIMYNGENGIPFKLTIGEDEIDVDRLLFETTMMITRGTPRWSQRGH